jgi:hypothetical protein
MATMQIKGLIQPNEQEERQAIEIIAQSLKRVEISAEELGTLARMFFDHYLQQFEVRLPPEGIMVRFFALGEEPEDGDEEETDSVVDMLTGFGASVQVLRMAGYSIDQLIEILQKAYYPPRGLPIPPFDRDDKPLRRHHRHPSLLR